MKTPILSFSLLALSLVPAYAAEPRVINIGTKPESVTKGFGGHYYVTVMNGDAPGDGVIKKIAGDVIGDFATGFDNPKGIAFVGGHLVTADMKKVWKIDAKGQKSVLAEEKDLPFPVGNFLNDVAAAPDGQGVFVSDMGASNKMRDPDGKLWPLESAEAKALPATGRIYRIGMDGKVSIAVDANADMPCPNGVSAPGKDELLIGEFFTGNLISVSKGERKILATGYRGADAIERDAAGNIFVSSWTQGKVWKLDAKGQNASVIAEGFKSAADFYLDAEAKRIVLPDMLAGTVTFLPLQ
jgi:SMP-30/Gluconolactonase/LRE-like region